MAIIPVDSMETDSTGDLFCFQDMQVWLEPDGNEDGLSMTDTAALDNLFTTILGTVAYQPDPTPDKIDMNKVRRMYEKLRALLDKIKKFRGSLWGKLSEAHKQQVQTIIQELLNSAPTQNPGN